MQVIPSINAENFEQAKRLIEKAVKFLSLNEWIHIDVGDGIFTPNQTWGNSADIKFLEGYLPKFEIHLMVESPDAAVLPWLEAGAKRMILHVESIEDPDGLLELCKEFNTELGLAIPPETSIEELTPFFNKINFYQILAVKPGLAGQEFKDLVLKKIKLLREKAPNAIIEVDGGINLETARQCKESGADILVSASYIWNSDNPEKAFQELQKV